MLAGGNQATSANPLLSFQAHKWKSPPELYLNDATGKKKEVLERLEASGPSKRLGEAAGWESLPVPENQPASPGAPEEEGHCTPLAPAAQEETNLAFLCVVKQETQRETLSQEENAATAQAVDQETPTETPA